MKKRVISAAVALAIIIPLIILGGIYFTLALCILATLAFKEVLNLKKSHNKIPNFVVFLSVLNLILLILSNGVDASIYKGFTYQLFSLLTISLIIPTIFYKEGEYTTKDAFYLLGSILFLGLAFNVLMIIRTRSLAIFMMLLLIPIINDTFAYIIGCIVGKHKMCPSISPNKTWEGAIGGLVLGSIGGLIYHHFLVSPISLKIVLIVLVLSAMGQIGDLVMSRIKRENGIKDFSNIMPGHGGILDRLDSTIFVFLAYIFLMVI